MTTLAQAFLTQAEQDRITRCVQEAEKRTSGEIVPMVVSASHSYPLAPVTGGFFIALPIALLAARLFGSFFWLGPDNMWVFLAFFAPLYVLTQQLIKYQPRLKKYFILSSAADEEVREAATAAFFREKLYRTRDANGILLFISVFERRVWVLGDHGINEKIPSERWQEIVDLVTTGIREGRQCEAICEAIERIGTILKEFFPIKEDDKDELHNLIIS